MRFFQTLVVCWCFGCAIGNLVGGRTELALVSAMCAMAVILAADADRRMERVRERESRTEVLTVFSGYVENVRGDTASVVITTECGKVEHWQFDWRPLQEAGVREGRRFRLEMVCHGRIAYIVQPIPDVPISPERAEQIRAEVRREFGDTGDTVDDF